MAKLYTKSGDDGFTSCGFGKRVKKSTEIIELYGSLDELSCYLAYAAEALLVSKLEAELLLKTIYRVQRELFELGSFLSSEGKSNFSFYYVAQLENEIDIISTKLPVLESFALPSGGECAVRIHLARAVCRRAERSSFALGNKNGQIAGIYLNRLSDLLYAAARLTAVISNAEEILV